MCMLSCFSHVWLCGTQWTVTCQAPLSMGILEARTLEWVAMDGLLQGIFLTQVQPHQRPQPQPGGRLGKEKRRQSSERHPTGPAVSARLYPTSKGAPGMLPHSQRHMARLRGVCSFSYLEYSSNAARPSLYWLCHHDWLPLLLQTDCQTQFYWGFPLKGNWRFLRHSW